MARKEIKKVRGVYEKEPGSGIWWICYKQGQTRKREKVGSRENAITLYQQRKTELLAGKKLPANLRKAAISFDELANEAVAWSAEFHPKDIRTVRNRMSTLVAKFGDRPAEDIEPLEIGNWLTANTHWAPATKNRYRALISLVYRQAMRNGKASRNPARLVAARVENNGRTRYLLDDEERELRKVMDVRYLHYLDVLIVALNTGMRKGEQFSLTWDAVDLESCKTAASLQVAGDYMFGARDLPPGMLDRREKSLSVLHLQAIHIDHHRQVRAQLGQRQLVLHRAQHQDQAQHRLLWPCQVEHRGEPSVSTPLAIEHFPYRCVRGEGYLRRFSQ